MSLVKKVTFFSLLAGLFAILGTDVSLAQEAIAKPWQLGFTEPASPVMERMVDFHTDLLWLISGIVGFVSVLLVYVMLRFNKRANPVPTKTTHNVLLEIVWTLVPVLILIVIAIPSMKLLYYADRTVEAEMTLKVTGYQWYWGYEYVDQGNISFLSYMTPDDEIEEGQHRLLETDNHVVVPIDTNIRILVTAADVLHAWAVPAFGVKVDAVPGRTNETWMNVNKEGIYYGQCSELCGTGHGFMPITIKAVSKEAFKEWTEKAKEEFSSLNNNNNIKIAYAEVN